MGLKVGSAVGAMSEVSQINGTAPVDKQLQDWKENRELRPKNTSPMVHSVSLGQTNMRPAEVHELSGSVEMTCPQQPPLSISVLQLSSTYLMAQTACSYEQRLGSDSVFLQRSRLLPPHEDP